ncbi:MAG: PaaI family thioesterase [Anaerovoracaceae bacterium]|jgi:uncharacterized protein (TIGR00369 family)
MNDVEFKESIIEVLDQQQEQPERLNAHLELELIDCRYKGGPEINYRYRPKEAHLNPYGGVHGGIICSFFDTTIGLGAVALSQKFVTTTDIAVSYLRPLVSESFRINVEYTQIGNKMIRGTGKVFDEKSGVLCATCLASYMLIHTREKGLQV